MLSSLSYLLREKSDKAKQEADEKRKLRAAEKQRKLEEKLKKEKELLHEGGEGEAAAEKEEEAT